MIDVVVGKASAAFVHASNVHVACGQITSDLNVSDEGCARRDLSGVGPGHTVVSGIAKKEGATANIEIVPRNVHPPVERGGRVVVCPTGFSIVLGVGVNTEVGPAIRVRRSDTLIATEPLGSAARIEPDGIPGAGWPVVQNNGVAQGIGERTLTVRSG